MQAGAVTCGDGVIAETVAVAKQQKWFGTKIFERERPACSKFVAHGQRGKEALAEQRKCFEFVAANGQG